MGVSWFSYMTIYMCIGITTATNCSMRVRLVNSVEPTPVRVPAAIIIYDTMTVATRHAII
jgi:hypothetical protein